MNNHYVPQFLLSHFCIDGKIQYMDLSSKKVESRNTRSVFSEKGYYPDEVEIDLCNKIERDFARLFSNKIVNAKNRIILSDEEWFLIEKYLLITILRVRDDGFKNNAWVQILKRDGIINDIDSFEKNHVGGFFENINAILKCSSEPEMFELVYREENLLLYFYVRDIIYSYFIFVKSNNAKEDFIINDLGWASYRGPMSVKKITAMCDMIEKRYDPHIKSLLQEISPQDYAVFPLSHNMALIAMSPAFTICLPGEPYNIIYPTEAPSLSKCLGFGNASVITPPLIKQSFLGREEYLCDIKQLPSNDIVFLNSVLISQAEKFIGFADPKKVRRSFENQGL